MSDVKNPALLFDALVAISKGCTNVTQAKSIAAEALREYSAGDVVWAVRSGVESVKAAVLQTISPGMYSKPCGHLTSYVLDIPYKEDKEYRCVFVKYRNGDTTQIILETPKGVDTNDLKNDLKDAGLGWFLKNHPEYSYWRYDEVAKTKIEASFRPDMPVVTIRTWNHYDRFRHGYIVASTK